MKPGKSPQRQKSKSPKGVVPKSPSRAPKWKEAPKVEKEEKKSSEYEKAAEKQFEDYVKSIEKCLEEDQSAGELSKIEEEVAEEDICTPRNEADRDDNNFDSDNGDSDDDSHERDHAASLKLQKEFESLTPA